LEGSATLGLTGKFWRGEFAGLHFGLHIGRFVAKGTLRCSSDSTSEAVLEAQKGRRMLVAVSHFLVMKEV